MATGPGIGAVCALGRLCEVRSPVRRIRQARRGARLGLDQESSGPRLDARGRVRQRCLRETKERTIYPGFLICPAVTNPERHGRAAVPVALAASQTEAH